MPSASSTTWRLVMMVPSASMTKPDPPARWFCSPGPRGSSSPKKGKGSWRLPRPWALGLLEIVMLTTPGFFAFTMLRKVSRVRGAPGTGVAEAAALSKALASAVRGRRIWDWKNAARSVVAMATAKNVATARDLEVIGFSFVFLLLSKGFRRIAPPFPVEKGVKAFYVADLD